MASGNASSNDDETVFDLFVKYYLATPLYAPALTLSYSSSYGFGSQTTVPFDYLSGPGDSAPTFCENGDCVSTCLHDRSLVFGRDPGPFAVCALTANVSNSLHSSKAQWNTSDISKLEGFGFGSVTGSELQTIASSYTECLRDACTAISDSAQCSDVCSRHSLLTDPADGTTLSFQATSRCYQAICGQLSSFADSDLAGIGVTISYFLQIIIALIGVLYLLFLHWRSRSTGACEKRLRKRQERKEEFVSSFVEFHKAQCFFIMAVGVAAMKLIETPSQVTEENLTMLPLLAAIGIQASLIVHVSISRHGRPSTYLMVITTSTWSLLSAVLWTAYYNIKVLDLVSLNLLTRLPNIGTCGGSNLADVCGAANEFGGVQPYLMSLVEKWLIFWVSIWAFSTLVLFSALWQWLLATKFPRFQRLLQKIDVRTLDSSQQRSVWNKIHGLLEPDSNAFHYIYFAATFVFGGSLCVEIYQLGYICSRNIENAQQWTLGQIIAVLVWAAPLAEFINLAVNGIIEGSNFRFANSLTVAHVARKG